MKDQVTILYGLSRFIVWFCTNSKVINFYLKTVWWNAAKLVSVAARLSPFLGARREVRRGRSEGIVVVLSWWGGMWFFGKFRERAFSRAFSLHIILVLFLKRRVWVKKNCMCLVVIAFNSTVKWSLRTDCSVWFFPIVWLFSQCGKYLEVGKFAIAWLETILYLTGMTSNSQDTIFWWAWSLHLYTCVLNFAIIEFLFFVFLNFWTKLLHSFWK